jgi:hypothetical protein
MILSLPDDQATPLTPPGWAFCQSAHLSIMTYLDGDILQGLLDVPDVDCLVQTARGDTLVVFRESQ